MKKSDIRLLAKGVSKKFKIPVPGKPSTDKKNNKCSVIDGVISYF